MRGYKTEVNCLGKREIELISWVAVQAYSWGGGRLGSGGEVMDYKI